MSKSRLSYVGVGLTSLEQLPDLGKHAQIRTLCLHGNRLTSLNGIDRLTSLTDLNVSSNELQNAHSLQAMTTLVCVNFASNRLENLDGLHALPNLKRLTVCHNMVTSPTNFAHQAACKCSLEYFDMQNNLITSLEDLAIFKSFTNLRHLKVAGGHPGNPICSVPGFQQIIVQQLPQLETLDGQPCATVRTQHLAAVRQQQHQQHSLPLVHLQQSLQQQPQSLAYGPVMACADTGMLNYQALALPAPALAQQPRPPLPAAAATALTQAKAVQRSLLDTEPSQSQGSRIAALESRLRDVVNMRSRPPLAPTENLLHQPVAGRKVRPKTVVHEVACQTPTSMAQVDRLHHDASHLKQELQHLASELDKRTSHAVSVEEQAEALVQQAQQDADQQVSCNLFYAMTTCWCMCKHVCGNGVINDSLPHGPAQCCMISSRKQ